VNNNKLRSKVLHRLLEVQPEQALGGSGIILELSNGKEIIDASGGAAVACIGHGNQRVADAIRRQARNLAYVHSGLFSSEPVEALADLLLGGKPGGLARALFVSSGSEAMEAALKLARQYFVEVGQPERTHFIARRQSYHGATIAALAAGGHLLRRDPYEPILPMGFSHVSPCFSYHYRLAGENDENYVRRLKTELQNEFNHIGREKIIALCAETVVGAASGCVASVPGYFAAMREVCHQYGALLILDEVMCGMGRTGSIHAWEQECISPDIQTIGKGLGGGYQPIGAVLVANHVVDALLTGSGGFMHGQTYQAHPVACAGALEVQRIVKEEGLVENVRRMGTLLMGALRETFASHPHVGDIRGRGLFWALEFVEDRETKRPFEPARNISECVKREGLKTGIGVYPGGGTIDGRNGDHILIAPPFNVTATEIEQIVERLHRACVAVF
jgi:adenosylmethionine-8-amino-7-oxononanoate aminotransferase